MAATAIGIARWLWAQCFGSVFRLLAQDMQDNFRSITRRRGEPIVVHPLRCLALKSRPSKGLASMSAKDGLLAARSRPALV